MWDYLSFHSFHLHQPFSISSPVNGIHLYLPEFCSCHDNFYYVLALQSCRSLVKAYDMNPLVHSFTYCFTIPLLLAGAAYKTSWFQRGKPSGIKGSRFLVSASLKHDRASCRQILGSDKRRARDVDCWWSTGVHEIFLFQCEGHVLWYHWFKMNIVKQDTLLLKKDEKNKRSSWFAVCVLYFSSIFAVFFSTFIIFSLIRVYFLWPNWVLACLGLWVVLSLACLARFFF